MFAFFSLLTPMRNTNILANPQKRSDDKNKEVIYVQSEQKYT